MADPDSGGRVWRGEIRSAGGAGGRLRGRRGHPAGAVGRGEPWQRRSLGSKGHGRISRRWRRRERRSIMSGRKRYAHLGLRERRSLHRKQHSRRATPLRPKREPRNGSRTTPLRRHTTRIGPRWRTRSWKKRSWTSRTPFPLSLPLRGTRRPGYSKTWLRWPMRGKWPNASHSRPLRRPCRSVRGRRLRPTPPHSPARLPRPLPHLLLEPLRRQVRQLLLARPRPRPIHAERSIGYPYFAP